MSISYPYSIQYSYTTETKNTVFMPDFSQLKAIIFLQKKQV